MKFKLNNIFCTIDYYDDGKAIIKIPYFFDFFWSLNDIRKYIINYQINNFLEKETLNQFYQPDVGFLGRLSWDFDKILRYLWNDIEENVSFENLKVNASNFIPILAPWSTKKWNRLNCNSDEYINNIIKNEENSINYLDKLDIQIYKNIPILTINSGGNHRTLYLYKLLINKKIKNLFLTARYIKNSDNIWKNIKIVNNELIFNKCSDKHLKEVIRILQGNEFLILKIIYYISSIKLTK